MNFWHNQKYSSYQALNFLKVQVNKLGQPHIYPKYCKQPIKEKYLLNGKLEISNQAYALAKIIGLGNSTNWIRLNDTNKIRNIVKKSIKDSWLWVEQSKVLLRQ